MYLQFICIPVLCTWFGKRYTWIVKSYTKPLFCTTGMSEIRAHTGVHRTWSKRKKKKKQVEL